MFARGLSFFGIEICPQYSRNVCSSALWKMKKDVFVRDIHLSRTITLTIRLCLYLRAARNEDPFTGLASIPYGKTGPLFHSVHLRSKLMNAVSTQNNQCNTWAKTNNDTTDAVKPNLEMPLLDNSHPMIIVPRISIPANPHIL